MDVVFEMGLRRIEALERSIYALNVTFSYRKRYILQFRGQKGRVWRILRVYYLVGFVQGDRDLTVNHPQNFGESYRVAMDQG